MENLTARCWILFAIMQGFNCAVQWECPSSTYHQEKDCLKQIGVSLISSPVYDISQMVQNCRTREGGESLTCLQNSRQNCTLSDNIRAIIEPGLKDFMEPALDYVCSFANLISNNEACIQSLDRSGEARTCIENASSALGPVFQNYPDITIEEIKSSLCGLSTTVADCQYRVTKEACVDDNLATVLGNFWYSAYAEWC